MSNLRSKVCQIANELTRERGGRPSDYMGEAWDIVKGRRKMSRPHSSSRTYYEKTYKGSGELSWTYIAGQALKHVGKKVAQKTGEKAKTTARNLDFTKPPKGSPSDVFSGLSNMVTKKPEGVEIPKAVKDEVKRMFKFW